MRKGIILLLSLTFFIIGCSPTGSNQSSEFNLPSDYNYAKAMLDYLSSQGVVVQDISKNSKAQELFQTEPSDAITITTHLGEFDLVYADGNGYGISKKETIDNNFRYEITNFGKEQTSEAIYDANEQTYFTKNDEFIAFTTVTELNDKITEYYQSYVN